MFTAAIKKMIYGVHTQMKAGFSRFAAMEILGAWQQ